MSSDVTDSTKELRVRVGLKLIAKILEKFGVPEEERKRLVRMHVRPQDYSLEERTEVLRLIASKMEGIVESGALDPRRKKAPRDARYLSEALRTLNRVAEDEESRNEETNERQGKRPGRSPTWTEED